MLSKINMQLKIRKGEDHNNGSVLSIGIKIRSNMRNDTGGLKSHD
ncbi:MAG TPA: hypothetical protein PLL71_05050 [Agriterribacter sp.]|nr:hypothetical protein [Agriterribacter sp.]HRQ49067.1 hypothetical protein [Agriterribacter sp.]